MRQQTGFSGAWNAARGVGVMVDVMRGGCAVATALMRDKQTLFFYPMSKESSRAPRPKQIGYAPPRPEAPTRCRGKPASLDTT